MEITRMYGQVKVTWIEDGVKRGFIVDEDAYDRLIKRDLEFYTEVEVGQPTITEGVSV